MQVAAEDFGLKPEMEWTLHANIMKRPFYAD